MRSVTYFNETPRAVHIETSGDFKDIWIRKNIRSEEISPIEEGSDPTYQIVADEAYIRLPKSDAPSYDEVYDNIDEWFEYASDWEEEKKPTLEALAARVDYLETMMEV